MSRARSSIALISLSLLLAAGSGCTTDEDAGPDAQDTEVRNGNLKQSLAKQVRKAAKEQGIKAMEKAPHIRKDLVKLGQKLAFDKELSGNRNISCMTCHHPQLITDDDRRLSIGEGGVGLGVDRVHPEGINIPRNAPPLFNLHAMEVMFWDGRVEDHGTSFRSPAKEELTPEMHDVFEFGAASIQAMFPVTSRREMRGRVGDDGNELALIRDDDFTSQWQALMARLGEIEKYREMFEDAYPGTDFDEMNFAHAANAIAAFEIDAFEARETPWDEFLKGDDDALTYDQLRGAELFLGRANCSACHNGEALTDTKFHNIALPQFGPGKGDGTFKGDDHGRERVSKQQADRFHFRTAPLRNIALTGPYGHAGQFTSLADFIAHYIDPETSLLTYDVSQLPADLQATFQPNQAEILAHLSPELAAIDFSHAEVPLLVSFMQALTDEHVDEVIDTIPNKVPSGLPVAETVVTTIENRAATLDVPIGFDTSGAREMQIWEPSMCDGEASVQVSFDRNAGTLAIDAHFEGLPYRPTYCYEYNPGNPYSQYPDCVSDGRWQLWFVGRNFTIRSKFWYDGATGQLIGNENDLTGPLPPTAFPVELPVGQMLCTDFFESDPVTLVADHHQEYDYHHLTDMLGSAGVYFSVLPPNLFDPSNLIVYYTQGGLDPSLAMDFDDVIEDIAEGKGGIMTVTSYEPFPKPSYLDARDNVMVGWGGAWPTPDPLLTKPEECGTNFQWQGDFGL